MASKQAQVPVTGMNRKCTVHPGKYIVMLCDTCGDQLVCTKCAVTGHKTHTFSELEDLVDKKRVQLTEFVESSGKQLGKLQSVFTNLQNLKQTVSDNSKTLEESVEKRLKKIQQQLNEIANNIKEVHRTKVGQDVTAIETRIESVNSLQQEIIESSAKCQAALGSQSVWDIINFQLDYDYNEKINSKLAQVPRVSTYHLTFDEELSGDVFGTLTEQNDFDVKDNKESCPPLLTPKANALLTPKADTLLTPKADKLLTPKSHAAIEPTLLKKAQHFRLPFGGINTICILNKNEAWISYTAGSGINCHSNIHLVTRKGDIISTVELASPVICLRLSSDKNLLASCQDNKMRCITPDGKISVLFAFHGYTSGFCEVGKKQDIVGCLNDEGQIVKYSRKGKVLQSLSSCFEKPFKISSNKVTGEMIIIDKGEQLHKKIVAVDSKMVFLWEMDNFLETPLESTVTKFLPNQACYDKDGNILVLFVSAKGGLVIKIKNKQFYSFKRTGSSSPYAIDVELDDMWIGMGSGDVVIMSPDI